MRAAIVGGGVLGLTLAHELGRLGIEADVLEAAAQPGGLATWADYGGFVWDRFYHVVLPTDAHLLALFEDLGLGADLRWRRAATGVFDGRRILPMSTPWDFARFPLLNPLDKARLAWTLASAARARDPGPFDRVTAADWLRRHCGRRTYDRLWGPLLRAKLGAAAEEVSAIYIWQAIRRLYSARSGGDRREKLGYVRGGYRTVLSALTAAIERGGGRVRLEAATKAVRRDGARVVVETEGGGCEPYDAAILTVPDTLASRIAPGLWPEGAEDPRADYLGVVCAIFVLERPVSDCYVINLVDGTLPMTGVIEMTNLIGAEAAGGGRLVYLPHYALPGDPIWSRPDGEVLANAWDGVRSLRGDLSDRDIRWRGVHRARTVQPLQRVGFRTRRIRRRRELPGLYLVNSADLTAATLNNNDIVGLAKEAAPRLAAELAHSGSQ
jgi:protoporphyrinogen oxidase